MTDQDITPLIELARSYGISRNYLEVNPFDLGLDNELNVGDHENLDFDPCEKLFPSIDFTQITKEKLELNAHAGALLFSTATLGNATKWARLDDEMKPSAKEAKLERPLLKFDNEMAVRNAIRRREKTVASYKFSPWPTDEENDEGLNWPRNCRDLCAKYDSECISEKLLASRDAIVFLKSVVSPMHNGKAQEDAIDRDLAYSKTTTFGRLSPPLLPLTPRKRSTTSSSPTLAVSTISDVTTSLSNELRETEDRLFTPPHPPNDYRTNEAETGRANKDDVARLLLPMETPAETTVFHSPPQRRKREALKVECPLTPVYNVRSLQDIATPDILPDFPSMSEPGTENNTSLEDDCRMLMKDLGPFAVEANNLLQNEQLQAADTLSRISVPTPPDYKNKAPWKGTVSRSQTEEVVREITVPIAKLGLHHYPGLAKMERKLPWTPFPIAVAKLALEEKIDHGGSITLDFLSEGTETQIDHDKLSWKPGGLRILDDAEHEEMLACRPPRRALASRQKSLQGDVREESGESFQSHTSPGLLSQAKNEARLRSLTPEPMLCTKEARLINTDRNCPVDIDIFSSMFSASQKLDIFMDLQSGRAPKRPRLEKPSAALTRYPKNTNAESNNTPIPSCSNGPNSCDGEGTAEEQQYKDPTSLPLPDPLPRRSIIISSHLLTHHRSFVRALAALYPLLDIVERDFSSCHIYEAGSATTDLKIEDADITLSPGTGILLTTLQKIKQKPLPGPNAGIRNSKTKLPFINIRERISRVAPRYERLFVLVSAGGLDSSTSASSVNGINDSDTSALLDLTIFANATNASITIDFVPQAEDALVRWVSGLIANVPVHKGVERLELLHEETLWEVFLRRAGMNAFAAQCVLEKLKPCDQVPGDPAKVCLMDEQELRGDKRNISTFGLPAFVMMSAAERMQKFERLFQGSEVLKRVSKLLDAEWLWEGSSEDTVSI